MPFSEMTEDSQLRAPLPRNLLHRRLLRWYDHHQRKLPWRGSRDPYRVWLSEVMLQQTRVAAVTEYYERFLDRFPTLQDLAAAPTASILSAWSGLGYYRRARMLHAAAKKIVDEMGGVFPRTSQELQPLPGIGRYTAAAIASIAFGEPIAVVDGNVERVLQRLHGTRISANELWQLAQTCVSRRRPGDFNQAMMELGATVCLPQQPKCLTCPLVGLCASRGSLPTEGKPNRQKREIFYRLSRRNGSVFLVQRPANARLMPEMWELPEVSCTAGAALFDKEMLTLRHSITVTDFMVRVVQQGAPARTKGRWVACAQLDSLPLTGLARKILRAACII